MDWLLTAMNSSSRPWTKAPQAPKLITFTFSGFNSSRGLSSAHLFPNKSKFWHLYSKYFIILDGSALNAQHVTNKDSLQQLATWYSCLISKSTYKLVRNSFNYLHSHTAGTHKSNKRSNCQLLLHQIFHKTIPKLIHFNTSWAKVRSNNCQYDIVTTY